jgi:hypothetical protein
MDNPSPLSSLLEKAKALQKDIENELNNRAEEFRYQIRDKKIIFEKAILEKHRQFKVRLSAYIFKANPLVALVSPVIYSLIVPLVLVDLFVYIYQAVCFPVYKIPKVKRSDYLIFDHQHLAYLNILEKINCVYCSYANGLIAYVREIAGRTEQYWCPIKHARRVNDPHEHYRYFADYGDAQHYHEHVSIVRTMFDDESVNREESKTDVDKNKDI